MFKVFATALMCLLLLTSNAQGYYSNWILGFGGGTTEDSIHWAGLMRIEFVPEIRVHHPLGEKEKFDTGFCPSAISDMQGNFLFCADARNIYNREISIVKGGDKINPGDFWVAYPSFYPIQNGALFIPKPDNDRYYYHFHKALALLKPDPERLAPYGCDRFYYTLLDVAGDGGMGEVLDKNVLLMEGEINSANMAACKHANGRDWWIPMKWSGKNVYRFFLLTPNGVEFHHEQQIGPKGTKTDWNGRDLFSEQGDKYIQVNSLDHLIIMDFDRCLGIFSNPIQIINPAALRDSHPSMCAAISPSGRFLYFNDITKVWQYDLLSKDISKSETLIGQYDGFLYDSTFRTSFYQMRLAPDQTIYINTFGGNNVYWHQIKNPDLPYPDCNFVQRAVRLKAENAGSLPLSANYKLGPVIGSQCDTIYRLKETWDLQLSPSIIDREFKIWSKKEYHFSIPLELALFDVSGRLLTHKSFHSENLPFYIDFQDLPSGAYIYQLTSGSQRVGVGKVMFF